MAIIVLALLSATAQAAPYDQKPTPHPTEGRENCLACHATGGVKPVPADHAGRTNETCLACHRPAAPSAPAPLGATPTPAPPAGPNEACLTCHKNQDLTMKFPDGKSISVYVNVKTYQESVHGKQKINCVDCHTDISGYPHPQRKAQDARDYSLASYELCRRCHPVNYAKTLDSIHAKILKTENRLAPVCTDCHGYHDVTAPNQPRTRITDTCAKCHRPIWETYKDSVHGRALVDEQNQDVPTCIDCHGVHQMPDPRTALFRAETPELCARCHNDEKLMAKYGLSTRVYAVYKEDFHGVTMEFYRTRWPTIWCYKATCTDCHGIHDIRKTWDPFSSVHPNNLLKTCQKCHPDAPPGFVSAWTGHYEPNPERSAPAYYIQLFYKIFIPVIVGGMVIYVALDAGRTLLNRLAARRISAQTNTKGDHHE